MHAIDERPPLKWTSQPMRFYAIEYRQKLDVSSPWTDGLGFGFDASNATFNTGFTNSSEFHRVRKFRPLTL